MLSPRQLVTRIQIIYPNPVGSFGAYAGNEGRCYCVGGAIILHHKARMRIKPEKYAPADYFPNSNYLAEFLIHYNGKLAASAASNFKTQACRYAYIITILNDRGSFNHAWQTFYKALKYMEPHP